MSEKVNIEKGRTFAGFGFTIALSNLRQLLLNREQVELKAVGFSPFPTLKPQVVTVKIFYGGPDRVRMAGRSLKGDRFVVRSEIPAIAKLFVNVPDTKIWLTNPRPAGFLRWEGPTVLPNDPLMRVDLLSGHHERAGATFKRAIIGRISRFDKVIDMNVAFCPMQVRALADSALIWTPLFCFDGGRACQG